MTEPDLLTALSTRFAALDPLLPAATPPYPGSPLRAVLPDGTEVTGVLSDEAVDPGSESALWSALRVQELHPRLPAGVGSDTGLTALLRAWLAQPRPAEPDSAAVLTWPSRDAAATRVLLDHGFAPLSVLAVAGPPGDFPAPELRVRRATADDLAVAVRLALAETAYSALVGGTVLRPDAHRIKTESITTHLGQGDLVLLAERDGEPVGLTECWITDSVPGSWAETRLRHGRWGYVNSLSVLPGARGSGVGRALMSVAHNELRDLGATGTFLYYNPPNPLSSVFWARQGYRPLWTVWEVRPAAAMR